MEPIHELIEQLDRDRVYAARRMLPEKKLLAGGELFDAVVGRMLAGIRMQHPGISDDAARTMLRQRLALARRLENRA